MEEQLREIIDYYAAQKDNSQEQLVAMLREAQELCGYIPGEWKREAAQAVGVKETYLDCIIRMYPSLKACDYQYVVTACTGPRCGNKGGAEILKTIRETLEIGKDGLSRDGRFCLRTQNCLKHCKTSPNMKINGEIYGNLTPEKVRDLLMDLRRADRSP